MQASLSKLPRELLIKIILETKQNLADFADYDECMHQIYKYKRRVETLQSDLESEISRIFFSRLGPLYGYGLDVSAKNPRISFYYHNTIILYFNLHSDDKWNLTGVQYGPHLSKEEILDEFPEIKPLLEEISLPENIEKVRKCLRYRHSC